MFSLPTTVKLKDGTTHYIITNQDLINLIIEKLGDDLTTALQDLVDQCDHCPYNEGEK